MAIKIYKPTSPGRRFQTSLDFEEITRSTPEKSLTRGKNRSGGRNVNGRITLRHRGGVFNTRIPHEDTKETENKEGVWL